MIIFEYLKKNRWKLLNKGIISAAILLVALLLVIGILLSTPVGLGLIVLFSANPVGIFFLFLSGLFFLSMICSVAWLVIEQEYDALKLTSEGKHEMAGEKDEKLQLRVREDSTSLTLSKLSGKSEDIFENTEKNKVQNDVDSSPILEEYLKESKAFVSEARTAILNQVFKPEIFSLLEEKFKELRKKYYQLARRYHPDKNGKESEEHFKQLGSHYENIEATFERLKTLHDEKDIWEILKSMDEKLKNWDETLQKIREQQAQMLRYLAEMKENTDEMKTFTNQLEDLVDRGAIDTSNPEVQKHIALFSASLSHNVNRGQTSANSIATIPVPNTFSSFFSAKWNFIRIFFNSNESLNNVGNPSGSEPISSAMVPPSNQ